MCSVVGCIAKKSGSASVCSFVMEGLKRLEYRGYDSAGIACFDQKIGKIQSHKAAGKLENLSTMLAQDPIDGAAAIGHTRWATHGGATTHNAHPHFDCTQSLALVHNGIIENYQELKETLSDHQFSSETDTEVIAHLLESILQQEPELSKAVGRMVQQMEGAYAFIGLLKQENTLVVGRKRSPLCVGFSETQIFVASDPLAFAGSADEVIYLPDQSYALIVDGLITIYSFEGTELNLKPIPLKLEWDVSGKQDHEHYMLKEIYEQKKAIHQTVVSLENKHERIWADLGLQKEDIDTIDSITIIACGTSWHAGAIGRYFFEQLAGIPVQVHLASEFRYNQFFPSSKSLYIAISQSGETADTLEAIRFIQSYDLHTIALSNVASSSLVRECDGFLLTQAGREIAVASTKAFSTQLTALYWLAHFFALQRGRSDSRHSGGAYHDLQLVAEILEDMIENYKMAIQNELAGQFSQFDKAIFLGRHASFPFALEAALKLKEIAYILALTYPAGELKHGPLALIDDQISVFVFSYQDELIYQKLLSNVQEVKARSGRVISFAFEGQTELIALSDYAFVIPHVPPLLSPLAMTGLMQYLFYAIAKERGCPIDQPRNLAKSVTVE